MSPTILSLFCAALFLVSFFYFCVGQAGASGYIAAMALFGLAPGTIKPTALVECPRLGSRRVPLFPRRPFGLENVLATRNRIGSSGFARWLSHPFTFVLQSALGTLLLLAALPLFLQRDLAETALHPPGPVAASLAGSGIGLVSGLTGVGGGVLITPILLYCRWATGKRAAAISAVFILRIPQPLSPDISARPQSL